MSPMKRFVIRLIVSVVFALIACRLFFRTADPMVVAGLALFMLGLAHLFEWARKRWEN